MRKPELVNFWIPLDVQALIQSRRLGAASDGSDLSASAYLAELVREDDRVRDAVERRTLLSEAKRDAAGTRRKILGALDVTDGNAAAAREIVGASDGDWRHAIEALELGSEIAKRWPLRRASQRKERHDDR